MAYITPDPDHIHCWRCGAKTDDPRDVDGRAFCEPCFLKEFPPDGGHAPQISPLRCDICGGPMTQAHETDDGLLLCLDCGESYRPDGAEETPPPAPPQPGRGETTALATWADALPDLLNGHKQAILQLEGQIKGRILDIGQHLASVRDALAHNKTGGFEAWVETELGWSKQTAYNYLNVFEQFGNRPTVAQLNIPRRALYALAAKSTPDAVRADAVARAERGERLTVADVERMISAALRQTRREPLKTADRQPDTDAPATRVAPATVCLFCKRGNVPVHVPEPGSRVGICRACARKAVEALPE